MYGGSKVEPIRSNIIAALEEAISTYSSSDSSFSHFNEHTIAFDPDQYDAIVSEISLCFDRIVKLIETGNNRTELTQINVNFFKITKKNCKDPTSQNGEAYIFILHLYVPVFCFL